MAVIDAVLTDVGLTQIAKHLVGSVITFQLSYFKMGEGGFIESGSIKTPKTPDPTLTRLDADGTPLSGTLTFTNGSPSVSGSGTLFLTQVAPGQFVRLDDDLVWAEILSVTDDNNLVLRYNYTGAGGAGDGSVIVTPLFVLRKSFVGGDLVFEAAGRALATVFLGFLEGNDDGFGANPEFFEVGLFDASGNLLAYGTFPGETKTSAVQFNKAVRLIFTRY